MSARVNAAGNRWTPGGTFEGLVVEGFWIRNGSRETEDGGSHLAGPDDDSPRFTGKPDRVCFCCKLEVRHTVDAHRQDLLRSL